MRRLRRAGLHRLLIISGSVRRYALRGRFFSKKFRLRLLFMRAYFSFIDRYYKYLQIH